jgi:hypothetical protein
MGLIDDAIAVWRAVDDPNTGSLPEYNGTGMDAQWGSAPGPNVNRPTRLFPDGWMSIGVPGTQYLRLPGTAGNYASTPDAAALDITGDIDIQVLVAMDDWTSATDQAYIAKYTGGQISWLFRYENTGNVFRFQWSEDGSALKTEDCNLSPTIPASGRLWIRITLDVDDGASNYALKFYTGGDGDIPSWSQLSITETGAAATSIFAGTAPMEIGSRVNGSLEPLAGKIYRAIIKDGINGTTVFDADFTDRANVTPESATFNESSPNAAVVTVNRSAAGLKSSVVEQPKFALGTDDYFEVADDARLDFGATDPFTVLNVFRTYDRTPVADMALLCKKDNLTTAAGYALYNDTGGDVRFLIADSVADDEVDTPAITDGALVGVAGVRDVVADDIEGYLDGVASGAPVADSTTLTLANALPLRIGATSGVAGSFADIEWVGSAIWDSVLTGEELIQAALELQGQSFDALRSRTNLRAGIGL